MNLTESQYLLLENMAKRTKDHIGTLLSSIGNLTTQNLNILTTEEIKLIAALYLIPSGEEESQNLVQSLFNQLLIAHDMELKTWFMKRKNSEHFVQYLKDLHTLLLEKDFLRDIGEIYFLMVMSNMKDKGLLSPGTMKNGSKNIIQ